MGHHSRRNSLSETIDLTWPFGHLHDIGADDLRETAYEIFFTACRSSPGFGGRNALTYYPCSNDGGSDSPTATSPGGGGAQSGFVNGGFGGSGGGGRINGVGMAVTSRVKRSLGLKSLKRSPSRRTVVCQSMSSPSSPNGQSSAANVGFGYTVPVTNRARRPLTSAEIMRQQMRVTEQSDNRLRKTLMRTLVGQMGRRAETIILPLELLRHLKPSEFNNSQEYHIWQRRQLKLLELGLLTHPLIPIEKSNTFAIRLKEIIQAGELKPIDTGKNSEAMRTLCNCVVSLSWRSVDGSTPTDVCHWADGYPININVYIALLNSIFDIKDETLVLDEVDELLELMKKTWSTLGISRSIHNVCFTWVLFQQYVNTSESDLLGASLAMLAEVSNDVKKSDKEEVYVKILSSILSSMKEWPEKRLLNYHEYFNNETVGLMESFLPLAQSASKLLEDEGSNRGVMVQENVDVKMDPTRIRVDSYIRSSVRNAFAKIAEGDLNNTNFELEAGEALIQLAKEVEELAIMEKETFSPILKKWHPIATGVAAVTLHSCYGTMLKQFLSGVSTLTNETINALQKAGEMEKYLVQMVAEDSADCDDGGKAIVREMVPYEIESIILNLLKKWIEERLDRGRECIERAKESETWNPKSKTDPYAHSAMELVNLTKETVDDFFEIQIPIYDYLVQDLVDGFQHLFREYTNFVSSCGSKQSYIPTLPPLTRCSRDSKFIKLWKKASPCNAVVLDGVNHNGLVENNDNNHPRPSTSRGTQRLYIRLNTLNYLLEHINSLDKTMCLSPRIVPSNHHRITNKRKQLGGSSSYFDIARTSIQTAILHVSEVAAYRLIFLDSNSVFYDGLYMGDVANARIRPALRLLKQNLTLLTAILIDRAQPLAIKQVMKASFEAYLMVLLAGGYCRSFSRSDHVLIEEDFESLKRAFSTYGEGLMSEEVVEQEAETVEGVVASMGLLTEQLVEDFSIVTCEASGVGLPGAGQTLPMPPTTGRWNRADPNTILRVLCHRNDRVANQFLKRTFQLARR